MYCLASEPARQKVVKGGTRWYMKVQATVYGGSTWRYTQAGMALSGTCRNVLHGIYHVYTMYIPRAGMYMIYTMYYGIYHAYTKSRYIHGIYHVYTLDIEIEFS